MTEGTGRRFARFRTDADPIRGIWPLPPDGMCLSAFVLVSPPSGPGKVLVGKVNPHAAWDQLGALDRSRAGKFTAGWMLPSSHLMFYEPPEDAAHRILSEQLGLERRPLEGAVARSEAYSRSSEAGTEPHWDLQFIYRATAPAEDAAHPAWTELRFIDPSRTPRDVFVRGHDDVLELAGYRVAPASG